MTQDKLERGPMTSLLRVVTLASATGKYGGPFDTASRQVRLANEIGIEAKLIAGFLQGDHPGSNSDDGIRRQLVPTRFLLKRFGFLSVGSFQMSAQLMRAVRTSDIVHVSTARELIPMSALLFALILKKPFVVQGHGMLTSRTSLAHRVLDMLVRPIVKRASSIIALTQDEADDLKSWLNFKHPPIHVLGNPLPINVVGTLRDSPEADEALFVARLHKRKRVGDFLAAAAAADKRNYRHQFVVVGPDGGELHLVENACRALDNTSYEGAVSAGDVTRRVKRTGVFVLTSEREPWGNVVAVALACGVPVVLPRSAALSRQIEAYGAGKVYEDSDTEGASNLIHELLDNVAGVYSSCSAGALQLAAQELSEGHQKSTLSRIYGDAISPGRLVR